MRIGFPLACLALVLSALPARPAEPAAEEVWALVRSASALYEALDGVDYDVILKSPELEAKLAEKTGGFGGAALIRFTRHNLVSTVSGLLPDVPEVFRQKAEARLNQEMNNIDALRIIRELGWTLFAAFLRTVDAGERYDVMEWNAGEALVEFNELSEPLWVA